jgi:xanthine/uracil/vitamin C permease (AzgA family)
MFAPKQACAHLCAMLEAFFKLRERKSSVRTEFIGGVTTFITMAYIMVVNPAILAFAGIPAGPGTAATILTAVFGCVLMVGSVRRTDFDGLTEWVPAFVTIVMMLCSPTTSPTVSPPGWWCIRC